MALMWTAMLTISAAAALWVFLSVIPRCRTSSYRSGLWRLRDRIVDDMLCDNVNASPAMVELVEEIETRIRFAPEFSPFRLVSVVLGMRKWPGHVPPDHVPARTSDRTVYDEYKRTLNRLDIVHLLTGSPSAWLFSILFGCYLTVRLTAAAVGALLPVRSRRRRRSIGVAEDATDYVVERVIVRPARHPELIEAARPARRRRMREPLAV